MKQITLGGRLVCLSVCLIAAACSKGPVRPATYPVTGTVTFKGAPLEGAQVIFVPTAKGGQAATGLTDAAGKYSVGTYQAKDGAQEGEYRIKIIKTDAKQVSAAGKPVSLSHEEEQAQYVEGAPAEPPKSLIPAKYDNEGTSGITHTVTKQATTLDITIEE